jgi:two-component system alkaline phosphatase synthesis response regulator PhoP
MSGKKVILVVDDEADILSMVRYNLEKEGFTVVTARNGRAALGEATRKPDLIILDVMMPEMDGWEVCRRLKRDPKTAHIPVLFLTAKSSEVDEVVGLEIGADDYIVKPISMRKLVARVHAALRRTKAAGADVVSEEPSLTVEGVEINVPNFEVVVEGKRASFTRREFETLVYLVQNRGRVVTRKTLLDVVWGLDVHVVDRTVDVHISKIREKLGKHASIIETVKGVGYRVRT